MHRAHCAIIFTLLACAAALAAAPNNAGTFFVAKSFSTGHSPVSIATSDFNGDGKLDIVTADAGDAAVAVLLGVGNGTFKPARNYLVDNSPYAVVVADFNGDGSPDLAVATGLDVFILLGNGDGTFRTGGTFAVGTSPTALAAGDFNGDGIADIALTSDNTLAAGVILGNGDGTFGSFLPLSSYVSGPIAAADLTGDGKLDLVIVNDGFNEIAPNVMLFPGNGDGTFGTPKQSASVSQRPTSIAVGDFNHDGILDVVVGNSTSESVTVLLGDGGNHIGGLHSVTTGGTPASVAVADVNGDGNPDLIVGNSYDADVTVLFGNSRGLFTPSANYVVGSGLPLSVAVGDFNGDGKLDIAAANQATNNVSVLLRTTAGKFNDARDYRVGSLSQYAATGDFNHDGKQDLVISSYESGLTIQFGNGNGTVKSPVSLSTKINGQVVAVDLNNDGFLDLVALGPASSSNVSVFLNNGDGTFKAPVSYFAGSNATALAVGDFNNDGKMDLAVSVKSFVSILLGNGDGSLQSPLPFSAGGQPTGLAVGDFNSDGNLDIVTGDANSPDVAVIFGKGNGTFAVAKTFPIQTVAQTVAVGFFHGVGLGHLDIAAYEPGYGTSLLAILLNNGHGTFSAETGIEVGPSVNYPTSLAVADFNLDGNPDIAVAAGGNNITVLFGNGASAFSVNTFGSGGGTPTGSGLIMPVSVVSADFNGDTKPDLAVMDGNDGFTMLLNQTK